MKKLTLLLCAVVAGSGSLAQAEGFGKLIRTYCEAKNLLPFTVSSSECVVNARENTMGYLHILKGLGQQLRDDSPSTFAEKRVYAISQITSLQNRMQQDTKYVPDAVLNTLAPQLQSLLKATQNAAVNGDLQTVRATNSRMMRELIETKEELE